MNMISSSQEDVKEYPSYHFSSLLFLPGGLWLSPDGTGSKTATNEDSIITPLTTRDGSLKMPSFPCLSQDTRTSSTSSSILLTDNT